MLTQKKMMMINEIFIRSYIFYFPVIEKDYF